MYTNPFLWAPLLGWLITAGIRDVIMETLCYHYISEVFCNNSFASLSLTGIDDTHQKIPCVRHACIKWKRHAALQDKLDLPPYKKAGPHPSVGRIKSK